MTLRLRLVVALTVLVAAGLAALGLGVYTLYARSQYDQLDQQLRNAAPLVTGRLRQAGGLDDGSPSIGNPDNPNEGGGQRQGGGPPDLVPFDTYAQLRSSSGTVLASIKLSSTSNRPQIHAADVHVGRTFSTGSASGSTRWRVFVAAADRPAGAVVVVAVPLTAVTEPLHSLVLIEASTAAGLLLVLAVGAWFVLRRGLRPLEHMSAATRSITSGDLSRRVGPADDRTEVGQLGLAVNTMLGELEEAFQEREETEQRLRQFLADASHELRTPLTSIQGFAELFRLAAARSAVPGAGPAAPGADGDGPELDLEVIMRRIEQESARMKALVEDLLLLARLDQTRPAELRPVDLAVVAADACSDAVAVDPTRAVTLDAPEPAVVVGDGDLLHQAVANLVTNALRHTPGGTPIELVVRRDGGTATLEVRDHGPGLDEEALAHVFDRFWQADRARVGAGSGLGLSIVAGIAAEHGGVATAADRHEDGGGASFVLRLPAVDQPVPDGAGGGAGDGSAVGADDGSPAPA